MNQSDRFFQVLSPSVGGEHQVVSTTYLAATAKSFDWVTALGADAPKGSVFVTLEALTADVYVRMGSAVTTGTTAANGLLIKADQPGRPFWVNPTQQRYLDVFSAGGGTIKVQVSSKIGARDFI